MTQRRDQIWDLHAIQAEIRRRDETLSSLAKKHSYKPSTFIKALRNPHGRVNKIIAEFIDVHVHRLWPEWFDADGDLMPRRQREKLSRAKARKASPEQAAA